MGNLGAILILCSLIIAMTKINSKETKVEEEEVWFESLCKGKEKVAKLRVYVQDVLGKPNPTVYEVARSDITVTSPTSFGQVRVLDNLVTAKPDINSKKLGRVQGLITSADLQVAAFTMNINFVFTSGKYNGSTLCILGRNQILSTNRELPIVGGTGVFGMARGRSFQSTYSYDPKTDYGVIEYNFHVAYV